MIRTANPGTGPMHHRGQHTNELGRPLRSLTTIAVLVSLGALQACSTVPRSNDRLDDARTRYQNASTDPQISVNAPGELKQASSTVDAAGRAFEQRESVAVVDQLAYLAGQQVSIAVETSKQRAAEKAVVAADSERDRIRLNARTREADAAKIDAVSSRQAAVNAQQDTNAALARADAERQAASTANAAAQNSAQQTLVAEQRTRELEVMLRELQATPTPRGAVVSLSDVLFDTDRAALKPGAMRNLDQLAAFFKRYPDRSLVIEGFTDSSGTEVHNLDLSEKRARAVRDALSERGVSLDRMSARGYGEAFPVAGNDTPGGRQMNRRVEVVISEDGKTVLPR